MLLGAPPDMLNCDTLPATMMVEQDGQTTIATFWRPTEEELAVLNKGGSVVLYVFGTGHPPVALTALPSES